MKTHDLCPVAPHISKQSSVLPRLHNQLPNVLMRRLDLSLDVGVETDEVEVLERFGRVGVDEGAGVAVEEAGEDEGGSSRVGVDDCGDDQGMRLSRWSGGRKGREGNERSS